MRPECEVAAISQTRFLLLQIRNDYSFIWGAPNGATTVRAPSAQSKATVTAVSLQGRPRRQTRCVTDQGPALPG
jgi:hypothetical protein